MFLNTIMAADVVNSGFLSWSTFAFALIAVGVVATFLSTYRYLLAYLVAGMLYWMGVEVLQLALVSLTPLTSWHAYMAALTVTWLPLSAYVVYKYNYQLSNLEAANPKELAAQSRTTTHTNRTKQVESAPYSADTAVAPKSGATALANVFETRPTPHSTSKLKGLSFAKYGFVKQQTQQDNYKEHTPIYTDYKPRHHA